MKTPAKIMLVAVLCTGFAAPLRVTAQDIGLEQLMRGEQRNEPKVDTRAIVGKSMAILHEREPELTPEEFAIYEKVSVMMRTNPLLATRMLESLVGNKGQTSPAFEFVLGNIYYDSGDTALSEKYYKSAIDHYPEFLRAWKNLGILYYASNRFDDAEKCFAKSVSLGDRDPDTLGLLGYCREMLGDDIAAQMDYMQAMSLDRENQSWREGLLRVLISGRQYAMAEPLLRDLIRKNPKDANLWLQYAHILASTDRKIEAMAVLESAQAATTLTPDELSVLGDLYAEQGLAAEAVATYRKVMAGSQSRGEEKLIQFAKVLTSSGNYAEAEKTLAAVHGELTPAGRVALLQTRAELFMAKKQWPEARHEIETLLGYSPLDGHALLTLGRINLEEEDLARAFLAFDAACKIPDVAYQANIELANVELKNHHYEKAAACLESALRLKRSDAVEDYLSRVRSLIPPVDGKTE